MKTSDDLIKHCKKALQNEVKYIYGAKMQILNLAQIRALRERYGANCVWWSDDDKAGHLCCDCSGLISSCTGIGRNSTGYLNTATAKVSITELKSDWNSYIGWGLWLSGHIGVVADKQGYYYAMDGSKRNMVCYPLEKQNWKYAIKLCDIDYFTQEAVTELSLDNAINILVAHHIITNADYWYNACKCVKYVDSLLINMAKNIAERG